PSRVAEGREGETAGPYGGWAGQPAWARDCGFVSARGIADLGTESEGGAVRIVQGICAAVHGQTRSADRAVGNFFPGGRAARAPIGAEICGKPWRQMRGEGGWARIGKGRADLPERRRSK